MSDIKIGWIKSAKFGHGGYQECMLGLDIEFAGHGWGVSSFVGGWSWLLIGRGEHAHWTEAERSQSIEAACRLLDATLKAAKKRHVAELSGTPVEVTFDGNVLKSWRVLEEVIPS